MVEGSINLATEEKRCSSAKSVKTRGKLQLVQVLINSLIIMKRNSGKRNQENEKASILNILYR